jgi:hypothetical protein
MAEQDWLAEQFEQSRPHLQQPILSLCDSAISVLLLCLGTVPHVST